jgi:hypothetical protein
MDELPNDSSMGNFEKTVARSTFRHEKAASRRQIRVAQLVLAPP